MTIDNADTFLPLLLAITLPFLAFTLLGAGSPAARAFTAALCIVFSARYVWWRWAYSMPEGQAAWQQIWAWIFLTFETMAKVSTIAVYGFLSRTRSRSAAASAGAGCGHATAPVDVFIATYNESRDILERTIVAALHIDHPDLRVWVLDDGARPWLAELAKSLGAHYTFRVKGKHAKAGNVNAGLAVACSTGRAPEFVLLLDADFAADRRILRRALPLFEDDVGIVQTPQHFFNADPVQSNLMCTTVWPDEQRFFFNHLLSSKDAWGAAFCCGTSAVIRVAALQASGGMATQTVTEDMLTTFQLREHGYRTVFLNERLSLGLAPEGLSEYISQRSRWCLGTMQQIYTRWGVFGRARIGLVNRLSFLDSVLYWTFSSTFKLMMISAPLIYWWTGTAVINSSAADLLFWLAPDIACGMALMGWLARNTVYPVLTDVTQLLTATTIARTVATALIKPFGRPFKVTAKGLSTDRVTVQWRHLMPFLVMAVGTIAGMAANMSSYSALAGTDGYAVNMVWSVFNVAILATAAAICVEIPRRRQEERFPTDEPAELCLGTDTVGCTVRNISVAGAALTRADGWGRPGEFGTIRLRGIAEPIPFRRVDLAGDAMTVRFLPSDAMRHSLIAKLFTGAYDIEVDRLRPLAIVGSITRKVFA